MRDLYNRYCELKAHLEGSGISGSISSSSINLFHSSSSPSSPTRSRPSSSANTNNHYNKNNHGDGVGGGGEDNMKMYKKLRYEKKMLQIQLHKYQDEFQKLHGRAIKTAEDREPIRGEYKRYKV
jgi:hypothetical protein